MLLWLYPDLASAGGWEGTRGAVCLWQNLGLCLSEVNPTPPLYSRPPSVTLSSALLGSVPGWGQGSKGAKQFTILKPQWDFKG